MPWRQSGSLGDLCVVMSSLEIILHQLFTQLRAQRRPGGCNWEFPPSLQASFPWKTVHFKVSKVVRLRDKVEWWWPGAGDRGGGEFNGYKVQFSKMKSPETPLHNVGSPPNTTEGYTYKGLEGDFDVMHF